MKGIDSLVNKSPLKKGQIIGRAISHFIKDQEPDEVNFNIIVDGDRNPTGYEIQVKTDENSIKTAKEFWEDEVEPRLRR